MHAATSAGSMALNDIGRGSAGVGISSSGSGNGIGRGAAAGTQGHAGTTSKKRLVMIIADPGRESTAAMEWALSHSIVEGDDILLLHVNMPPSGAPGGAPPSRTGSGGSSSSSSLGVFLGGGGSADAEFMETMRAACKARHPRARIHAERVEPATEGREAKAQTILAESQRRGVELLVIGHRRFSSFLG
jgi:nucleotide-binding universal stress UspA family protein